MDVCTPKTSLYNSMQPPKSKEDLFSDYPSHKQPQILLHALCTALRHRENQSRKQKSSRKRSRANTRVI